MKFNYDKYSELLDDCSFALATTHNRKSIQAIIDRLENAIWDLRAELQEIQKPEILKKAGE